MLEPDITDLSLFTSEEAAVDYYFRWYRFHGYPAVSLEEYDPPRELERIKASKLTIGDDGMVPQSMVGCGFLWAYFPHWVKVSSPKSESLEDAWLDDEKLRTLMRKVWRYCTKYKSECGHWHTNRVRQLAKVYCAKQSPSNFRPTVAKALMDTYGHGGAVYDPCGGWGGRMAGFLASGCRRYTCCEPSTLSAKGLQELANTFAYVGKRTEVHCIGAEDYAPDMGAYDMALTSPPYFNTEKYADEPTQSYMRFPEYDQWLDGFLAPMLSHVYDALREGGVFLLNIANVPTAKTLEDDALCLAAAAGFEHVDTLLLVLSSIAGKGIKAEPIYVLAKGECDIQPRAQSDQSSGRLFDPDALEG